MKMLTLRLETSMVMCDTEHTRLVECNTEVSTNVSFYLPTLAYMTTIQNKV